MLANVSGGGLSGQAGAIKHGISRHRGIRWRVEESEERRSPHETPESKRKKPGQPGARKNFQFSKR